MCRADMGAEIVVVDTANLAPGETSSSALEKENHGLKAQVRHLTCGSAASRGGRQGDGRTRVRASRRRVAPEPLTLMRRPPSPYLARSLTSFRSSWQMPCKKLQKQQKS